MKSPEKISRLFFALRVYLLALLCFFLLQGVWCAIVWADAVPPGLAQEMANKWLAKEAKPMGSPLGGEVENVKTFTDSNGRPVYYVVGLKPGGFVVVSADDLVEPIVCFSSQGSYGSSAHNPLVALVSRDIPARVNASRSVHAKLLAGASTKNLTKQEAKVHKSGEKAFSKWTELLGSGVPGAPRSSVSDVRVAPLLQTRWGQDYIACGGGNKACYNYYTPPYDAGNVNNYYDGCVATAMAQYMRFWQYPTDGVGTGSFTISVDCEDYYYCDQTANLRGGNGNGGPYNWSQMLYAPNCSTTDAQRQAIGALCYDAGVSVGMDYESDGSAASMSDAAQAMVSTFGYSNAIIGGDEYSNVGDGLNGMINPNLDSGNPVMLGIDDGEGDGHAVVADGYGYQGSTLYHHLNMGWDGADDIWYNLPNVDSAYPFDIVDSAIYNIYIDDAGEIISGRVIMSDSKSPVSGATVTAVRTGGGTYQTTTNANGIYALVGVPSGSDYTISVAKSGHLFADRLTSTGLSQDHMPTSGNCWAMDFVSLRDLVVAKCTVSAGKNNNDAISVSGTLNAASSDISAADEIVVDINSADLVSHFVQTFPRNSTTFKNGKFKCAITDTGSPPVKTSFAFNTKTAKFSFTAKNVDLSGLSCPLTVRIEIGDYNATVDINEATVNGKKTPIPINLLMGVKDSLRVDRRKFSRDRNTGNITQFTVSGGFSDKCANDANLLTNPLDINVGSHTFTIPASNFKNTKGKFACSRVDISNGIASATFDFNKCTFSVTIKNTDFTAYGTVDFIIDFAAFSGRDEVSLP